MITSELEDPTAFVCMRIGKCYQQLGNIDLAVVYHKKAVHEDPLLDKGWILLTDIHYEQKNFQKALHYISEALKIDDDNVMYWKKYSDINMKLNLHSEAIRGIKSCLQLNDESLHNFTTLSDLLLFTGDFKQAVNVLLRAKKLYMNFAEIEYRLSGLFFILSKLAHGETHLIRGMQINYDYHTIVKELFPSIYEKQVVQQLLKDFKKSIG